MAFGVDIDGVGWHIDTDICVYVWWGGVGLWTWVWQWGGVVCDSCLMEGGDGWCSVVDE